MAFRLLLLVLGVAAVQYTAGAVVFLTQPDTAFTGKADAAVALAGSTTRLPVALEAMRGGRAPVLLVSIDTSGRDPERAVFCDRPPQGSFEVTCRLADPYSTRGEARMLANLARERNWDSVILVTSRFHLFRANRLFQRCTDAAIFLRGASEPWWRAFKEIPLEWTKLLLAETTRRGC
jgi:uncharacterized SAM-binding protein YcdF (DUF218 family)